MKKIFGSLLGGVLGTVVLCSVAQASPSTGCPKEKAYGNIPKGAVETGGAFKFNQSFASSSESMASIAITVPLQYFVADHLSIGGRVGYVHGFRTTSFDNSSYAVGPAVTYYLCPRERLAPFVNTAFEYNKSPLRSY